MHPQTGETKSREYRTGSRNEMKRTRQTKQVNKAIEHSRRLFLCLILLCFLTILIYESFTPMLSDDLNYKTAVREASGIGDLFLQEYVQYRNWTGRSVAHLLLRFFLYGGSKTVFNLAASAVFTLLIFLLYRFSLDRIDLHEDEDLSSEKEIGERPLLFLFLLLLVWMFGESFAQTILWETGAFNYLFTTTIILGNLALFDHFLMREEKRNWTSCASGFLCGLLSGWCSENTSGGMMFLMALWVIERGRQRKENPFVLLRRKPELSADVLGSLTGFCLMIFAPGNAVRSSYKMEAHTGLLRFFARFLKITNDLKTDYLWPLLLFTALLSFLLVLRADGKRMRACFFWFLTFLATAYALLMAPEPQKRALFGAGIFLFVAIGKAVELLKQTCEEREEEVFSLLFRAASCAFVAMMTLSMSFVYLQDGANLARIRRDLAERYAILEEAAKEGKQEVVLPLLHPQFKNKYSMAYVTEISAEDSGYYVNQALADYYGIAEVRGIRRDKLPAQTEQESEADEGRTIPEESKPESDGKGEEP